MPEVAADATEAVLAEWMVAEHGTFAATDTLATVETEKALVDVEAEEAGVVLKALVPAGAQVEVGAPIAVLGAPGEQLSDLDALLAELGVAEPVEVTVPDRRDVPTDPESAAPVVERVETPQQTRPPQGRVFASPLARKLAKEAGLGIEEIDGTGPRNRVLRRDVERAVASQPTGGRVETQEPDAPGTTTTDIPHTRLRKAIASRLQESKRDAPHFYLRATIRADRLVALREEINEDADTRVSLNDLVIKAVGAAHLAVPEMNVVWAPDAVRQHQQVDIAVAVATDRGLLTPVVRDVPSLTVTALARQVRDLAERGRSGRLKQDELEGGTISVTNLGMYGVEEFAAIINPPHVAILAVGAVREEPVVEDGELTVGKVLTVTLSVDHRPVDGVIAARWLAAFTDLVTHPIRILAS
ncbi:MAG: 2-oxo acid dehydrogenase subunit E2 [Actinomycetota bacterium]|nr:2-oxo acid dehydrogenase subunit E2 [Actinomycetota bacterium]